MRTVMRTMLLLLPILLWTVPASAAPDAVVVYCDSYCGAALAWPTLYENSQSELLVVTNRGIPGASLMQWSNEVPVSKIDCAPNFIPLKPDWECWAVVMLGTNDLIGGAGLAAVATRAGVLVGSLVNQTISVTVGGVEETRELFDHVVIVIEPANTGPDPILGASRAERLLLRDYLQPLCDALSKIECVDLTSLDLSTLPNDIHPDPAGDLQLCNSISPALGLASPCKAVVTVP